MGTGSSLSSIDHNIFQKPYDAAGPGVPNGRGNSPPYPSSPNAQPLPPPPAQHMHYVPPIQTHPSAAYGNYNDNSPPPQPPYFPSSYSAAQQHAAQHNDSSPNIFYTPPSLSGLSRAHSLPPPFVKQEHPPMLQSPRSMSAAWSDELIGQGGGGIYGDYFGRKRKLSPCEMAYPEHFNVPPPPPVNCGVPNCTSCPPSHTSSPSNHLLPSLPYYYKTEPPSYSSAREPLASNPVQFAPSLPSIKQEKKETLTTTTNTEGDGYRWRKYGRKTVKGSPYPRSYYKCTFSSCNVKKQVEMTVKDDKMVVKTCIYKGEHNHERPCITFAKASSQEAFKSAVIAGFVRHEKMLQGAGDVPRLSVETTKDVDFMADGYRWRKYGQKYVKGSGYPRSYYKCTEKDCSVKKQVDQHGDRITNTYEGVHTHPPCTSNSRKRRKCSDGDRSLGKDIKEEEEEEEEDEGRASGRCPTPPGSSSEGCEEATARRWMGEHHRAKQPSGSGPIQQEVRLYGAAINDDEDDEEGIEEDFDEEDIDDEEFVLDIKGNGGKQAGDNTSKKDPEWSPTTRQQTRGEHARQQEQQRRSEL